MKYTLKKAGIWLGFYVVLALFPLGLGIMGNLPASRGFALELGVALGFIGLGLLGLQFLYSGRIRQIAPSFGMDNLIQYHREMGIIAFLFILAHPIIIISADVDFLSYFDPDENLPRAVALIFVIPATVLLIASSLWRLRFGLSYEKWRLVHGVLSLGVLFVGAAHSIQVAHYLESLWKQLILGGVFVYFGYLVVHTRLVRPWLNLRKPYRVADVIAERGDSWTLELEPEGHEGKKFECGQFMWLSLGPTPFSMQQHPFSISSACTRRSLSVTAKALGDFTSTWKDIEPGTKAFLEGPFGSFTPVPGKNLFMVAGGIGITPVMSMIRTMHQRKDPRKVVLIYGNPDWEGVTFREELEEISRQIDLKVLHVLENPPEGWKGETGFVDIKMLDKYLPSEPESFAYYICGPKPMQDAAELSLRDLGIDWKLVYSERFQII